MLIRTGNDFPEKVREYLRSWGLQLLELQESEKLSSRGELVYRDTTFGPKAFRYLAEPLKIEPKHLQDTPLLSSRSFHFLSSPDETSHQVKDLFRLRNSYGTCEEPLIIWEPAPLSCLSENKAACLETVALVDVFSPNHIELAAIFNISLGHEEQSDRNAIDKLARECVKHGICPSQRGTIVVRAGHEGCCVYSRQRGDLIWLPPFYTSSEKVVDPTGAGNAFLGGFAIGLLKTGDDLIAACYGTVASAFALEQIGLPELGSRSDFKANEKTENMDLWNEVSVQARLQEYVSKVLGIVLEPENGVYGQSISSLP